MYQQPDYGNFNFNKYLSDLMLDKQNRIMTDPMTGGNIDPNDRRKLKNFKKNPYGINVGNALDPNFEFADNVLSQANQPFDPNYKVDIMKRAGYA